MDRAMEFLLSKLESRFAGTRELASDLDGLRNSLPRVNRLMDRAEWWRFKDPYIERLLKQLRDAAYDAEDVIAECDYYELKQKIEGQITNQFLSSLVSFVKDLVSNSANKVKDVQTKLDSISGELETAIGPLGLPDEPNPYGKAMQRETSSLIVEPLLGREKEVEMVVKLMLQLGDGAGSSNEASSSSSSRTKRRKTDNFSVLPIVGIGGMGKTALAQQIYNDDRVKGHFNFRIWICVSDYFDLKKITREMIEATNRELTTKGELKNDEKQIATGENFTNLDSLQQKLRDMVASRRYLLVLDDAWHEQTGDWESLCKPLRSGLQGSMILITTRLSRVAEVASTLDPIKLEGLPDGIYWELFKKCAFSSEDTSSYPELEDIGKKIAVRLKGSPLAAKTLGGILRANMTTKRWKNILDSELWQLKQDEDGVLAALRVSYQYLPVHLKRCFLICSLFPKDFSLDPYLLTEIWMADGIIAHEKNISFYNKGNEYFEELKSRSFILRYRRKPAVLHDLMHDLAKSISLNACNCQEENQWSLENHSGVRHLLVYRKPIELIDKEIGIGRCKKLRSLVFLNNYDITSKFGPSTLASLFNQFPYLRLLDLTRCQIEELPENIGNLKLLFYINLRNNEIRSLPDSICKLYNLQVINVDYCPLESFPKMFHNLINLRLINHEFGPLEISSKIPEIGKLTSLERLSEFTVLKEDGHKIEELKNMIRLRDDLEICKLENVEGRRDAAQACLNNKEYLTELTLSWSPGRNTNIGNGGTVIDDDILEGLEPHPNLESLSIMNYGGRTPVSWLCAGNLPCLRDLTIDGCSNLKSLQDWFVPNQLSSLKSLYITDCVNLVSLPLQWISSSSIDRLCIQDCPLLSYPSNLVLPSSQSNLILRSCGELDKSIPNCLENAHSLNFLALHGCQHVTSLPSQVNNDLKTLILSNCAELWCIELSNPSILKTVSIRRCPKLIQYDLSTMDNETPVERIKQLQYLKIDNTSLLKLPFLRNPPHALGELRICGSPEERMFTGDVQSWLNGSENLKRLYFVDCSNLESLPEELHTLVTLKWLEISNCPKIQSLPENGLPPLLDNLSFDGCHPVLTEQLKQHKKAIEERKRQELQQ